MDKNKTHGNGIKQNIRTAPYYNTVNQAWEYELMRQLRGEIVPKLRRRMPAHHLCGWRADFLIHFVSRHKRQYPFFLRTDICRFYPSVRHNDVVTYMQIAYRDLLGLPFVPAQFKRRYIPPVQRWLHSLPVRERGIPLASPVSALLAPMMLLSLWLELRRRFDVKLVVYADDLLVMCRSADAAGAVFAFLQNRLQSDYNLQLHPEKTVSGRFAAQPVDFCGWNFKGGYARISDRKIDAFQLRLKQYLRYSKNKELRPFIKRLNQKIDGFGNYYKHGDVGKQFDKLDVFIRRQVRERLGIKQNGNRRLAELGLHSLTDKLISSKKLTVRASKVPGRRNVAEPVAVSSTPQIYDLRLAAIQEQLAQLIGLHRSGNRLLKDFSEKLTV